MKGIAKKKEKKKKRKSRKREILGTQNIELTRVNVTRTTFDHWSTGLAVIIEIFIN